MIVMRCPADVLTSTTGYLTIVHLVYGESTFLAHEHFEITLCAERVPYMLCRFGHHVLLEVMILVVSVCGPALSVTPVFTRKRDNFLT